MCEPEEDDTSEDIWHLRESLVSRTPSAEGPSPHGVDENHLTANDNRDISRENVPEDQAGSRHHLGDVISVTRSFPVLANLKDTISSVFQVPAVSSLPPTNLLCRVVLLDGRSLHFSLKLNAVGRELFTRVTGYLGMEQDEFFGLTYSLTNNSSPVQPDEDPIELGVNGDVNPVLGHASGDPDNTFLISSTSPSGPNEPSGPNTTSSKKSLLGRRIRTLSQSIRFSDLWKRTRAYVGDVLFWLDLDKRILEQCKGSPCVFHFQVKYFIPNPDRDVYCAEARRHYCLQLRQHLLTGRLPCSFNTHILLGAYISQFVLGDAHPRHSGSNDSVDPSARSSFCSRRGSRGISHSEAQSFVSERACSLAEPESSDLDWDVNKVESNKSEPDGIAWTTQSGRSENNNVVRRKCATLGNPGYGDVGPSFDCSRSIRSEVAHSTYLSILPHLNRLSRSSSCGRPRTGLSDTSDDDDRGYATVSDGNDFNVNRLSISEWTEPPGANWPYPSPTGYYCPEMLTRIARLHRRLRGMSRSHAECRFLNQAKRLSMYGVELHLVKHVRITPRTTPGSSALQHLYRSLSNLRRSLPSQSQRDSTCAQTDQSETLNPKRGLFVSQLSDTLPFNFNAYPEFAFALGVCMSGLILYWGQLRVARFPWLRIVEISLQNSNFILIVRHTDEDARRKLFCYTLAFPSPKLAMHLFASCVGHHKYFRLGIGRSQSTYRRSNPLSTLSKTSPVITMPPASVTEPTTTVLMPLTESRRPSARQQHSRLRNWLQCFIPRTMESDSRDSTRRNRLRRRLYRDRSTLSPQAAANAGSPDSDAPVAVDTSNTTAAIDSSDEVWLRRDNTAVAPTSPPEPSDSNAPECRTACASTAEAVEATPCRPSWVSRTVVSRLNDSPIVPTIRRVRSTLCGTQRTAVPNSNRPVSFSAMHKRGVLNGTITRPVPPPRPKQPPTPADTRQNRFFTALTKSPSINDSGKATPNLVINLDSIPLVPTYTAIFTPQGLVMQASRLDEKPFTPRKNIGGESGELPPGELININYAPQLTNSLNSAKRTNLSQSIPVVPTRSVRLTFSLSQMNAYRIPNSTPLKTVRGLCIPLVATRSVYLRYT